MRSGPTRRSQVLVVDDDPDILEALGEILDAEGFQSHRARNGREALERARVVRPDLVLLDLLMPVMDGLEFLHRLRAQGTAPPVLLLSADRSIPVRARELGAAGFLSKPFDLVELLALVRHALGLDAVSGPPLPSPQVIDS
jgi:two-component system, chemotaxis family, chemotaxis protein CheY